MERRGRRKELSAGASPCAALAALCTCRRWCKRILRSPEDKFLRISWNPNGQTKFNKSNLRYSRGDEHGSGSDQLQLGAHDRHEAEEAVDVVNGQAESFALQAILLAHLNQPVDENGAHRVVDVRLLRHVLRTWPKVLLSLQKFKKFRQRFDFPMFHRLTSFCFKYCKMSFWYSITSKNLSRSFLMVDLLATSTSITDLSIDIGVVGSTDIGVAIACFACSSCELR